MDSQNAKHSLDPEVKHIICDIEGTTTSISFVKNVLFPYARFALESYLTQNFNSEECQICINLLREQQVEDNKSFGENNVPQILSPNDNQPDIIESVKKNVLWQMDSDRKAGPLKKLQGNIWRFAYENMLVKGHVYKDVVPAFERWIKSGIKIYIYSSGSVDAQKMLFGYSSEGNLLNFFSGHFDTSVGAKTEKASYEAILKAINSEPRQSLFLTDLTREAVAATSAGMKVCLIKREDNNDKETQDFMWATTFDDMI